MTQPNSLAEEFDGSMVRIPAGRAVVGLRESQRDALAARDSVHRDMLRSQADYREAEVGEFWMDRYPVTRGQFRRFLQGTHYKMTINGWLAGWAQLTGWHEFLPEEDALPMTGVNADDAAAYAAWCGKRLPTELEWEKAWRGEDGRLFPWGDEWQEGFTFRSPGDIALKPALPVGTFGEIGPYGLGSYGLVLEWVRGADLSQPCVLAGTSFLHTREYSFCPANRSSWHPSMRIYNSGFRCASDSPPRNLVAAPTYRPADVPAPKPIAIRRDLYKKQPIQLIPTERATVLISVPWFPQSIWVLDCPEGTWGEFAGANAWPGRPEPDWRIPWKLSSDHQTASYVREKGDKRQAIKIWVHGDTVHYQYDVKNVAAHPDSFCFKTFSPFFTSQERRTQVLVTGEKIISADQQAQTPGSHANLGWSLGDIHPPQQAALRSFDKTAMIRFPARHCHIGGNGVYPCVHILPLDISREASTLETSHGQSSITFSLERGSKPAH